MARSTNAKLERISTDLARLKADRFCRIPTIGAPGDVLPGCARSQIARTRALFDRFSDISRNLETEMWSRTDLNCRPPLRLFIARLSADLATNLLKVKAAVLERASSPCIRPRMFLSRSPPPGVAIDKSARDRQRAC